MIAGNQKSRERHPQDYYPTPEVATLALLKYIRPTEQVWEPACGKLHISNVLRRHGCSVLSTDIDTGDDFLLSGRIFDGDIITNPPYSLAVEFVNHGLLLTNSRVCMLLPIGFMTSQSRKPLMVSGKLQKVIVLMKRLKIETHYGLINSQFNHAWYIFQNGEYRTELIFE